MNVYINKKEFEAISAAEDQINSNLEGSNNKEYVESTQEILRSLKSLMAKYKRAL